MTLGKEENTGNWKRKY